MKTVLCTVHTVHLMEGMPAMLAGIAPWTEPVVTQRGAFLAPPDVTSVTTVALCRNTYTDLTHRKYYASMVTADRLILYKGKVVPVLN
jgi:hypothetical protein